MEKGIKLTEYQKKHLDSILWLLDINANRSGRTFVLAYAFIKIAKKQKGSWIGVFDHIGGDFQSRFIIREIKKQLESSNENAEFKSSSPEFRIMK